MKEVNIQEILQKISDESYKQLSEDLIDILLASQKTAILGSERIRRLLDDLREGRQSSLEGVKLTLESCLMAEEEKTLALLERSGYTSASKEAE